jgi:hypothetical protein
MHTFIEVCIHIRTCIHGRVHFTLFIYVHHYHEISNQYRQIHSLLLSNRYALLKHVSSLKGSSSGSILIHSSPKFNRMSHQTVEATAHNTHYTPSWILHLLTHFVELAAGLCQMYSLTMTLYGLKYVAVTYSLNKVWLGNVMSAYLGIWYLDADLQHPLTCRQWT